MTRFNQADEKCPGEAPKVIIGFLNKVCLKIRSLKSTSVNVADNRHFSGFTIYSQGLIPIVRCIIQRLNPS